MSISTSLSRQVLSAQITTDHSELGRALAAHLPVMEQKLSTAYGVQAKVELSSGASSTSTTSDQPQQGGGRQQPSSSKAGPFSPASTMSGTSEIPPADMAIAGAESSRLDIRV